MSCKVCAKNMKAIDLFLNINVLLNELVRHSVILRNFARKIMSSDSSWHIMTTCFAILRSQVLVLLIEPFPPMNEVCLRCFNMRDNILSTYWRCSLHLQVAKIILFTNVRLTFASNRIRHFNFSSTISVLYISYLDLKSTGVANLR